MPGILVADNAVENAANQIAEIKGVAQANNAWSAEQASIQREWQEKQNAKAMAFNQNEAAKNRDWQQMMSNTAHQREVKDLMAAGLNPVLSAMNGNGAAVGSGATASGVTSAGAKGDTDESSSMAIVNLLGSILAANTQIEAANVSARTQEAVADKYTAMEHIVASINAQAGLQSAGIYSSANRYSADQNYNASVNSAATQKEIAELRARVDQAMQDKSISSNPVSDSWNNTKRVSDDISAALNQMFPKIFKAPANSRGSGAKF